MANKCAEVFSIFGQIEAVVAESMIDEGKFNRIEATGIPSTALVNEHGQRAQFAVVVPSQYLGEFNRRISELLA